MSTLKKSSPVAHLVLALSALLTVGPFLWMMLTSFKTQTESIQTPPTVLPAVWHAENYALVFQEMPFLGFYFNTLCATLIVVAGQVAISAMAAYAFARLKFPGRDLLFVVCLSILMVPVQLLVIPQFMIINRMGLLNSMTGLVLPNLFSIYGAFMLRQFFQGLPKELEEAAIVDGLNPLQTFWYIMLPLVKSGLIAFGIIVVLWSWNSLLWPLIVNTEEARMTLPVGLASLGSRAGTSYPVLMAGAVMAIAPLLLLFVLFQRHFIAGLASAGIKG
ncbi:carbohydrate ABC transporter permease [Burkholderiaceae bacterium DAT-1]|nr:carbohydrate ABC transporter permease [Burkholderiaceae bacterium DAT-1]